MRFIRKTRYEQDISLFKHGGQRFWYGLLAIALLTAPWTLGDYGLSQLSLVLIFGIAGLGLMLLSGYTGQISLGHAAFLGIGAYTQALLNGAGWSFPVAMAMAALITAAVGVIVGLPALRLKGMYLGIATLAFGFIIEEVLARWESVTGGNAGIIVSAPRIDTWSITSTTGFYILCLVTTVLVTLFVLNLLRSPIGRAFVAIRDSEISAQSMGIHLARYKTLSFALSAAITGVAGALYAHKMQFISPEQFGFFLTMDLLLLVIIGGVGSVHGAFFGAVFLIAMPQLIGFAKDLLPPGAVEVNGLQGMIYGLVLIAFVLLEPGGLYGRWLKIRTYLELVPFYRKGMLSRQKTFQKSERLK